MYTKPISHDGACHAFLYLESLQRENIFQASLTKIERQEIFLSIDFLLYLLLFSLTSYKIKNLACISAWCINKSNIYKTIGCRYELSLCLVLCLSFMFVFIVFLNIFHISGSPWY